MYLANPPGYTSFTVFPQPDTPLWADGTILYYGNLRGEWLQAENSGKVLAHEVTPMFLYVYAAASVPAGMNSACMSHGGYV